MAGSTFGQLFCVTTFGESHGPAIGCVVDGCPPGLPLAVADIQPDLDRRRPGTSRHVTQRQEPDAVEILSGVHEGITTGTPIALLIRNQDARSKDYGNLAQTFRPGHADYTYFQKYGRRDHRGGGRSSARLTAPVVAAAAIARKWLRLTQGTQVAGYLSQIGEIAVPFVRWSDVAQNPFWVADAAQVPRLEAYLDQLRRDGDSCGARVEVVATGMPVGLGAPLYDKLDADIAYAMMGINAVKGVEIGAGFRAVAQRGSEHGDELTPAGFVGNNAGGVLGGISTGQDLTVSIAIKPTSSIRTARRSIDLDGKPVEVQTFGRHDPCVGLRAAPIAEAMLLLVLMDHCLLHRAQCGDVRTGLAPIAAAAPAAAGAPAADTATAHAAAADAAAQDAAVRDATAPDASAPDPTAARPAAANG
ncbi:MAG: chorismate synthase [Lautropia sp.]